MNLIKNIGLVDFRKAPAKVAKENSVTCVLSHSKTIFYAVTPEKMESLNSAELAVSETVDLINQLHSSGYLEYSTYSQIFDSLNG